MTPIKYVLANGETAYNMEALVSKPPDPPRRGEPVHRADGSSIGVVLMVFPGCREPSDRSVPVFDIVVSIRGSATLWTTASVVAGSVISGTRRVTFVGRGDADIPNRILAWVVTP